MAEVIKTNRADRYAERGRGAGMASVSGLNLYC